MKKVQVFVVVDGEVLGLIDNQIKDISLIAKSNWNYL